MKVAELFGQQSKEISQHKVIKRRRKNMRSQNAEIIFALKEKIEGTGSNLFRA